MDIKEERQSFPIIIDYQGEEMYLVDCTDLDVNKINDIELYTSTGSSYRWEKRRILVLMIGMANKARYQVSFKKIAEAR
ncbi:MULTISPECIES: hypothetical protein [unclassified Virgibacillus]|uniref:hypothetical protein n=1 Tax=unclassified Virgibacillus TaxID=2620237 RepID=UPI0024DED9D6|nr:hypothetical protein [Virgibacillus sp. LDC-1]